MIVEIIYKVCYSYNRGEKAMIKLTKKQEEVMNVLWESEKPMIASEILKMRDDFNINTVQSTLRTLVKKKYVEIAEIVYSGTVLTRSYKPLIKREDFTSDIEIGIKNMLRKENLFAHYVNELDDLDTILKLDEILQNKKKSWRINNVTIIYWTICHLFYNKYYIDILLVFDTS